MIGSCERDADGSARPEADAVRAFAARHPDKKESGPARQGISSTDKYVTDGRLVAITAGGFSSLRCFVGDVTLAFAQPSASDGHYQEDTAALVNGWCGRGLDSSVVSVKLPMGQKEAYAAALICETSEKVRSKRFAAPVGRYRGSSQAAAFRIMEVLPPPGSGRRGRTEWDPAAICRTQQGIRQDHPAL